MVKLLEIVQMIGFIGIIGSVSGWKHTLMFLLMMIIPELIKKLRACGNRTTQHSKKLNTYYTPENEICQEF